MLEFPTSPNPQKKPGPGRRLSLESELTPAEIKQEANRLLTIGLSAEAWKALDWLAIGGVMSTNQLALPARTLRKYAQLRLLTRLPFSPEDLAPMFTHYGLTYQRSFTQLYVLGPVGLEIASQRHAFPPVIGHLAFTLKRTMHDVILNEIVLRLVQYAFSQGWSTTWLGTNSAALYNLEHTRRILEPDALLIFRKELPPKPARPGKPVEPQYLEVRACLEYHNEDRQSRATEKVYKYEGAFDDRGWVKQWQTDDFPLVLAVFERQIVGKGYQTVLQGMKNRKPKVTYCGKYLEGVLADSLAFWANLADGERVSLLPGVVGENVP